jgi:hypothetical protein
MKTMSLDKAQRIVEEVVAGRKRLGKYFTPRNIMDDVLDALVMVYENANLDAPSKEEITRLKRQLAACQNREKSRLNKDLDKGNELPFSGDHDVGIYVDENGKAQVSGVVDKSTSEV